MMLLTLTLGCWTSTPTPTPPEAPATPTVEAPAFPPPPQFGVAELAVPPDWTRATEVVDKVPVQRLDITVDFDRATYAEMNDAAASWGFSVLNGDGEVLRLEGEGQALDARLAAVPGVARVTPVLERAKLPDGNFRSGSERYGALTHTWHWPDGSPAVEAATGGALPATPELPNALGAGGRSCLLPIWEDLTMGVSVGPGWERALAPDGRWGVLLESYGACAATGWTVMAPDASVDNLKFGDRTAAEADDAHFHELAIVFLSKPQPEMDADVMSAVLLLSGAENAVLARAVREAAPGQSQMQLLEAFTARDPDGALAISGGATTRVLRAQALGQDELARAAVLKDPASPPSAVVAALVGWRPGAGELDALNRFLSSPDPKVRELAWEAKFAGAAEGCGKLNPARDGEVMYQVCPAARVTVLAAMREKDAAAAEKLLAATLLAPETVQTGVDAVRAAAEAKSWLALVACADSQQVDRDVRLVALRALVAACRPEAGELALRHGSFVGMPASEISAPSVADCTLP